MSSKLKILIVLIVLVLATMACNLDPFRNDEPDYPVGNTFAECMEWYINYQGMSYDEAYDKCMPDSP